MQGRPLHIADSRLLKCKNVGCPPVACYSYRVLRKLVNYWIYYQYPYLNIWIYRYKLPFKNNSAIFLLSHYIQSTPQQLVNMDTVGRDFNRTVFREYVFAFVHAYGRGYSVNLICTRASKLGNNGIVQKYCVISGTARPFKEISVLLNDIHLS